MDAPVIIQNNLKAYRQLVAFCQAAEGFTIGFIEANFKPDLQAILDTLKSEPKTPDIQWLQLDFLNPDLRFLRDELVKRLGATSIQPDKRVVILLTGLEQSIGMSGEFPPMLQDLNFVRDDFTKSVPYPLIFCLPDYAISRLARYAPDFWAWKSGLFHFQSSQSSIDIALAQTLNGDRLRESLELDEIQTRIDLLQRILMETSPSGQREYIDKQKTKFEVLRELGLLHLYIGQVEQAKHCLTEAISSIPDTDDFEMVKASLLHVYGYLLHSLGQWKPAIFWYEQSLILRKKTGDILGQAATLHCIASIYAEQGEGAKAVALYQQSLAINKKINNLQGEASNLHQLADIHAKQGELEKATSLYQRSLEIKERIGNIQGQAATLHQLACIYANQGEVQQAISLYQQSIEIDEKTGNIQGKANTITMMAQLKVIYGDIEEAIQDLQTAIEIFTKLKSPIVQKVQDYLDQIIQPSA